MHPEKDRIVIMPQGQLTGQYRQCRAQSSGLLLTSPIHSVTVYTKPNLPGLQTDASAVKVTGSSYNTPVKYTSDPLLSGYCSKENIQRIAGSAMVAVPQGTGKGDIHL
jgi:hypothetical protein